MSSLPMSYLMLRCVHLCHMIVEYADTYERFLRVSDFKKLMVRINDGMKG